MDATLREKIDRYNKTWRRMSYSLWSAKVEVRTRFNRPRRITDQRIMQTLMDKERIEAYET